MNCELCRESGKRCIPGRGNPDASLMLVGEAPGKDEEKYGKCWIGKAGRELENYLTTITRVEVDSCYLNNLVKFHPPNDRDPTKEEIETCSKVLDAELAAINPRVVACLGVYSSKYFLGGDLTMDRVHGIPIEVGNRVILPMYHPASGLHNTSNMIQIASDFEVLGRVIRGKAKIGALVDPYPEENCAYQLAESERQIDNYLAESDVVAIDTESVKESSMPWWGKVVPWCVSVSTCPGTAMVVMTKDKELIRAVGRKLGSGKTTTLIHNIMYDLPILNDMGIDPAKYYDTMVMAYLTQTLPQGLKDLAYRIHGMKMNDYKDMVEAADIGNAYYYLSIVKELEWEETEPELVWEKGVPRVKKGWGLGKRVAKIIKDYERSGGEVDLRDRWENIEKGLRRQAEYVLGLMPIGDLSEIRIEDAVRYSARDADATYRVWPELMEMVRSTNIERD